MVVLSNPTGNTIVRAIARALRRAGWLRALYTTIGFPDSGPRPWVPHGIRAQLLRRHFEIEYRFVHSHPGLEIVRLVAARLGAKRIAGPGGVASVEAVYRDLDRHVARIVAARIHRGVRVVYGYEDASEYTFAAARELGVACVYEMPIAHWHTVQRLLHEEADRLPEWRRTIHGLDDSPAKLERKSTELDLADAIVVPSRFVLESLPAGVRLEKRCVLARFGAPPPRVPPAATLAERRPLRVIFVGAMTQRKGLADLFAAIRLLARRDVELVVLGALNAPMSFYRSQLSAFTYVGPCSHADVLETMRSCDVLALPAVVEGRALVQQEALACGLPLIVTANAGGDDLVDEGRTGFLVPIRSPEAIADRIGWLADHREALPEMRRHALRRAAETSWTHYEDRVLDLVGSLLDRAAGNDLRQAEHA